MLSKLINSNTHRISCISSPKCLYRVLLVERNGSATGFIMVLIYDRDYLHSINYLRYLCISSHESFEETVSYVKLRVIIFYCRLIIIYVILFEKVKTAQTVFFLNFIKAVGISVVMSSSLYESIRI